MLRGLKEIENYSVVIKEMQDNMRELVNQIAIVNATLRDILEAQRQQNMHIASDWRGGIND